MGIKELLLQHKGADMYQMWDNERRFTTGKVIGFGVEQAFPEFLSRKGRDKDAISTLMAKTPVSP